MSECMHEQGAVECECTRKRTTNAWECPVASFGGECVCAGVIGCARRSPGACKHAVDGSFLNEMVRKELAAFRSSTCL